MVVASPTLCMACKHRTEENRCAAFPDGIPDEIHPWGIWDHREPLKGDNGIQWEPVADKKLVEFVVKWAEIDFKEIGAMQLDEQ